MRPTIVLLVATLSWSAPARVARADPPPSPSPAAAATTTGAWGWWVLGSGMALGAATTAYGLTFDCTDGDLTCQRHASVAIWGGLGVAALSSAVGLAIVESGQRHVQLLPMVADATFIPGGIVLRGSF